MGAGNSKNAHVNQGARSIPVLDDAEHRPLRELMVDQPRDLRRPDALPGRTANRLTELVPRPLDGALGPAVRAPVPHQVLSHVVHGVMMPRPDAP